MSSQSSPELEHAKIIYKSNMDIINNTRLKLGLPCVDPPGKSASLLESWPSLRVLFAK